MGWQRFEAILRGKDPRFLEFDCESVCIFSCRSFLRLRDSDCASSKFGQYARSANISGAFICDLVIYDAFLCDPHFHDPPPAGLHADCFIGAGVD